MKEQEWKNNVFVLMLNRNPDTPLSDILEEVKTAYNHLHDNYEELEDWSSGPQDFDLNAAIGKVAFELKNDPTLAGQVRQLFSSVTYDKLMRRLKIDDPRANLESEILKLSDDLAKEMIDSFINIGEYRNQDVDGTI